jgi:ferritin-like metal-binding protein YciE
MERFLMASMKTLDVLFLDALKDIYFAEKEILKALPKMARAVPSEEARQDSCSTRARSSALNRSQSPRKTARGKTQEGIQGIIAEARRSRKS